MIDWVDKITDAIESNNIIWLIVLFVISIGVLVSANLKHVKGIWEFRERKRKVRLNRLVEADQCKHLDESLRQFIHEEIRREHFLAVTGVSAGKPLREKLIELYTHSPGGLRYHHLKRAALNLYYEEGKLHVRLSGWDKFELYLNAFLAIGFLLFWILFVFYALAHRPFSLLYLLAFILLGFASLSASLFFILGTRFWFSAKVIQGELDKLEDEKKGRQNPALPPD